jgi:predicted deacetylase
LAADCFAPPRWLVSRGTLTALRRKGFALCADLAAVRDLRTGTVHKGRVQGFGHGELAEPWWCYALVLGAARLVRRGGLVRLAADSSDLERSGPRQALLDAVDIAVHHGATGVTYRDLLRGPLAQAA